MVMAGAGPRSFGFVCRSCQLQQLKTPTRSIASIALFDRSSRRPTASTGLSRSTQRRKAHTSTATIAPSRARPSSLPKATSTSKPTTPTSNPTTPTDPNPMQTLSNIRSEVSQITSAHVVPDELAVLEALNRILEFSNVIVYGQAEAPIEAEFDEDSSTILDDLDEDIPARKQVSHDTRARAMTMSFRNKAADTICDLIYTLVRDPKVFITLTILQVYTRVQCLLGRPEYLPQIFHMYANKPKPIEKSSPIQYKNSWPNTPQNAIPIDLSDAAIECAIQKKDMPLAIAIVDTTVATKAFRYNKLVKKGTLPLLGVSATPLIAYAGASWLSTYQNVWDEGMAVATTMAGATAYIGTLSIVGFVAITTWNDQMERVTWATGTGMTHRWLREEERACFDRIAQAWGFQERWRRGEEQGEEWDNLRELIGMRSMILDKTELMDGME